MVFRIEKAPITKLKMLTDSSTGYLKINAHLDPASGNVNKKGKLSIVKATKEKIQVTNQAGGGGRRKVGGGVGGGEDWPDLIHNDFREGSG